MTLNKKTKTTTIITSMIFGLLMLSPTTSLPLVHGQQVDQTSTGQQSLIINKDLGISDLSVEKLFPAPMSDNDKKINQNTVLNHGQIKQMLSGKHYKFMGTNYVGNVFSKNVVWKPELHINVENTTQIAITINPLTNQVDDIQTFPITSTASYTGSTGHGFADDNINTANSVDGLSMVVPYITHTTPGTSTTEFFMLNAISSLHGSNACSSSSYPNTYFAQVGLEFDGNGVRKAFPIWADTLSNCVPTASTAPYTANHSWFFKVYTATGYWVMYGVDQQDGTAIVSQSTTGQTNTTFQANNDPNTSVFFENTNKGTSWSSEFTTNPSAQTLQYHNHSTNTWSSWPSSSYTDQKATPAGVCSSITVSTDTTIMSVSGGTITWNMPNMASQYPAC